MATVFVVIRAFFDPVSDHFVFSLGVYSLLLAACTIFIIAVIYGGMVAALAFPQKLQIWICSLIVLIGFIASLYAFFGLTTHLHQSYCAETDKPVFMYPSGGCRIRGPEEKAIEHDWS